MQHDLVGPATIRGIQIASDAWSPVGRRDPGASRAAGAGGDLRSWRVVAATALGVLVALLGSVAPRDVAAGGGPASALEVTTADTQPPNVWWAPADSILARDTAQIAVGTWDDVGVVRVEYWVDSVFAMESTAGGSFEITLPLAGYEDGTHHLSARAFDGAGNTEWTATYRSLSIDRSPPYLASPLASASHTPGAFSKDTTIEVSFGSLRDNNGLLGYDWGWSTDPAAAASPTWEGSALGATLTSEPLPDGRWFFHLRLVDQVGNVTALRAGPFRIDTVRPRGSMTPLTAVQAPSFVVAWNGADPGGKVATFDVRYRRAAPGAAFGAAVRWKTAVVATSATFTGVRGSRYCFATRATDKAGNVSTWSAEACTRVAP